MAIEQVNVVKNVNYVVVMKILIETKMTEKERWIVFLKVIIVILVAVDFNKVIGLYKLHNVKHL